MKNFDHNRQEHPALNNNLDEKRIRGQEPAYGSPYDFRQDDGLNHPSRYNRTKPQAMSQQRSGKPKQIDNIDKNNANDNYLKKQQS